MDKSQEQLCEDLQRAVIELGKIDLTLAYEHLAGSFVAIVELLCVNQDVDPKGKINLIGGKRKITLHAPEGEDDE